MTSGPPDATSGVRPLLTVVRGAPTPEQLAAVIALVTSRATAATTEPDRVRSPWAEPVLRSALPTGPGAWRTSGLPR